MYKQCRTEQSAARQRQMEQGLVEIMGNARYEDITVSDLCEKMNIPRKSFYRYFSSKDGALHGLIDHTLMDYEMFDFQSIRSGRTLEKELGRFFRFWHQQKLMLDALERSGLSGILIERSISYSVAEGGFPGRFLSQERIQMRKHLVRFAVCGLMTMMLQWHHDGYAEDVEDMARIAARLVTRPLFPNLEQIL